MMLAPGNAFGQAFLQELEKYGPNFSQEVPLAEARQYCEQLAKTHYENFSVASLLVPRSLRPHFYSVYAYCRWSDDLADEVGDCATSTELLNWWRSELNNCFQGRARHPVFVALRSTIEQFQMPIKPFDDLLSAFLQDQTVKRYENDADLVDYCCRSANPVGRIILKLAHVHDSQCDAWSDSICTGLQLANFCQDIQRDAAIGRIYLPRSRWQLSGLDEHQIMSGQVTEPLRHAVRQWIEDIRPFFYRGQPLLAVGPRWLSRDLQLFIGGGLAILDAIERNRFDVWTRRIEVSRWTKLGLVLQACIRPRSKLQKRNGNR